MRKLLLYFLLFGCINHHSPNDDLDTQYWICKNEESIHHNRLCHDNCYVAGDPHKFCWLLSEVMCKEGLLSSDAKESCQVFEKSYHDQNN